MEFCRLLDKHVDGVFEIEKECFSNPWPYEGIVSEIKNEHSVFIVCVEKEKVFGYASMHVAFGECYINNIAVTKSLRKKGIGEKLCNLLIDVAREIKAEFITLEVRASNENAINLYKKLKFKTQGARKNFYENPTEDALIMTRTEL